MEPAVKATENHHHAAGQARKQDGPHNGEFDGRNHRAGRGRGYFQLADLLVHLVQFLLLILQQLFVLFNDLVLSGGVLQRFDLILVIQDIQLPA